VEDAAVRLAADRAHRRRRRSMTAKSRRPADAPVPLTDQARRSADPPAETSNGNAPESTEVPKKRARKRRAPFVL
jgi:hypothetical protein